MQFYNDYSEKEKKYFRWAVAIFVVGAVCASFAAAFSYVADAKEKLHARTGSFQISATGEGKIAAKPDIAVLSAGVVSERKTVKDAQKENTDASNAVKSFLMSAGVLEKDIKSTNYSIYPQYFYPENRKPEIIGYQVRNTIEVKIRDLTKVDDILGGVVESGANEVGSVSFTIEDPNKLKEQARKLAIQMAMEKAKVLSRDLGVRLKRIVGFTENEGGFPPPIMYAADGLGRGGMMKESAGPELSPGEQEITVTVTVTYDFSSR